MLTIFSCPRPFLGKFNLIQRNAIQSWISACPGCEIILIGDDEGTAEIASEFKLKHIPKVERNEKGVFLRNFIFSEAQRVAKNDLLCHINADIILTRDFLKAIKSIKLPSYLLSGRRWDLDINEPIDFSDPDWEKKIHLLVKKEGKLHGPSGNDYFVFPRNAPYNMPPFSVKHCGWDNWSVYRFKSLRIPVIDATEAITVLHQNHNPKHLKKERSIEGKKEIKLAGGFSSMCTLRDADFILTKNGLERPKFPRIVFASLSFFYPWRLMFSIKRNLQNIIFGYKY